MFNVHHNYLHRCSRLYQEYTLKNIVKYKNGLNSIIYAKLSNLWYNNIVYKLITKCPENNSTFADIGN